MPLLLRTEAQWRAWRAKRSSTVLGLVPTMGSLHEGHLALMREAKRRAEDVVTTIFVNPTQFGPQEDLSRYPRDLEGDVRRCGDVGVDVVFAPVPEEMYPQGHQTFVEVQGLSRRWEGERRPGHFRGVATVVTQLLALFRPHVAVFGQKDYQQLKVLERLVKDLHLGVELVALPTVRDADGLAMSSRNAYLSSNERIAALSLSRGLRKAQALAASGETSAEVLMSAVRRELTESGAREDYVALVDSQTLEPLEMTDASSPARMLVAAFVGKTRLIDNAAISASGPASASPAPDQA
ncbi:MAG: pantoate--beta-alanine ligase [Myxococcaceae bacterium]